MASTREIQRTAINEVLNILGTKVWRGGFHSGRRRKEMMEILEKAREASGCIKPQCRSFLR
jgi:hypothetical protein